MGQGPSLVKKTMKRTKVLRMESPVVEHVCQLYGSNSTLFKIPYLKPEVTQRRTHYCSTQKEQTTTDSFLAVLFAAPRRIYSPNSACIWGSHGVAKGP